MSGALHAKAACVDAVLVVGSTNWTTPSRANFEVAAEVQLSRAGQEVWEATFSELWEKTKPILDAEQELALGPMCRRVAHHGGIRSWTIRFS